MDKAQRLTDQFNPPDLYTILQHEQHFDYFWPPSLVVVDSHSPQNFAY